MGRLETPPRRPQHVREVSVQRLVVLFFGVVALLYTSRVVYSVAAVALHLTRTLRLREKGGAQQPALLDAQRLIGGTTGSDWRHQSQEGEPGRDPDPPQFILYRLVGNNMVPLQCHGQLYRNTLFTLDHEPELPRCRKVWVLNNIVNQTEQAMLLHLLVSRGYTAKDIIVRQVNYTWLAQFPEDRWTSLVTAQNEARNFIIQHGINAGARWILAFDGNQFYTLEAWKSIVAAAQQWEERGLKYFKVPMYPLYEAQNESWLNGDTRFSTIKQYAPVLWESQLAFRNDSDERYREGVLYGRDNKLEMLDRVCGTGRFNETRPAEEGPADTGLCGCHNEVGCDRRKRKVKNEVALRCGYSVRLWYFPCQGINATQILDDNRFRAELRKQGHDSLAAHSRREFDEAKKKDVE